MKAVILSGTPSNRSTITEHLSVSDDVEKPSIKSDQVLELADALMLMTVTMILTTSRCLYASRRLRSTSRTS